MVVRSDKRLVVERVDWTVTLMGASLGDVQDFGMGLNVAQQSALTKGSSLAGKKDIQREAVWVVMTGSSWAGSMAVLMAAELVGLSDLAQAIKISHPVDQLQPHYWNRTLPGYKLGAQRDQQLSMSCHHQKKKKYSHSKIPMPALWKRAWTLNET